MRTLITAVAVCITIANLAAAQTSADTSCVFPPMEPPTLLSKSAAGAIKNGIFGHVLHVGGAKPIRDARIELEPGGKAVSSDSLGHFQFTGVPNGRYLIRVMAIGYYTSFRDSVTIGADGLVVVALLDQPHGLLEIVCPATPGGRPPRER